jgi:hypothetical protein
MSQTVKINGVTYNEVKEVKMPLASDTSKLVTYSDTSDANATAEQIKLGATAYVGGKKITGTMPANGAIDKTLDVNSPSYSVPKGYTDGGTVDIVVENKTATPSKTTQNITPTSGKVLAKVTVNPIPAEYITTADANAEAAHIAKDKTAYVNGVKVTGTHTDAQFTLTDGVLSIS